MYEAVHLGDVTKQAMGVIAERMFKARPEIPETERQEVKDALGKLKVLAVQSADKSVDADAVSVLSSIDRRQLGQSAKTA